MSANMIAIEKDSRRPGTCRRCGAAVEWAARSANGAPIAFDPPIVLIPTMPLDERAAAIVFVDAFETRRHEDTCPGRH